MLVGLKDRLVIKTSWRASIKNTIPWFKQNLHIWKPFCMIHSIDCFDWNRNDEHKKKKKRRLSMVCNQRSPIIAVSWMFQSETTKKKKKYLNDNAEISTNEMCDFWNYPIKMSFLLIFLFVTVVWSVCSLFTLY